MTVDTSHGIITGVDCYPANHRESDIILNHIKCQQEDLSLTINRLSLDGGYDVGAVHRGLELLGIDGYTAIRVIRIMLCEKDSSMIRRRIVLFVKKERNCYLRDLFLKRAARIIIGCMYSPAKNVQDVCE